MRKKPIRDEVSSQCRSSAAEAKRELDNPGIGGSGGDTAEGSGAKAPAGLAEGGRIGDIKNLSAELHCGPLGKMSGFHQCKVEIAVSGAANRVPRSAADDELRKVRIPRL